MSEKTAASLGDANMVVDTRVVAAREGRAVSEAKTLPKIGPNELAALAEIGWAQSKGWGRTQPFWWRRASIFKLHAYGWVVRDLRFGTNKSPAWIITEAGRDHLLSLGGHEALRVRARR